jgi:hypothetical protein
MKRFLFLILVIIEFGNSFAQAPNKFSFQAVMRASNGTLITNTNVGIKISILQGSSTGLIVYSEVHNAQTNINGLVTLEIGGGVVNSGNFSTINWSIGIYFIRTETDPAGGTNYSITGSSQLLSVPYALYSSNGGTPGPQGPQGPQGNQGPIGPQGTQGGQGQIGIGISTAQVQNDSLFLTLTNAQKINTGKVKGEIGLTGVGISSSQIINDSLWFLLTNSQILNAGKVTGGSGLTTNGSNAGDLLYWNGLQWSILPKGANGQFLTIVGGLPSWTAATGAGGLLPSVRTDSISSITGNSAIFYGAIIPTGASITDRGCVWGTTPNPTTSNSFTLIGGGTGNYTCNLSGLLPNTTYYCRGYSTNSNGVAYGGQVTFTTQDGIIVFGAISAASNTSTSANFNCQITNLKGLPNIARGFCIDTLPNPTIIKSNIPSGSGLGAFNSILYNLLPNKLYYIRAYGTNSAGVFYSSQTTVYTPNGTLIVQNLPPVLNSISSVTFFGYISNYNIATVLSTGFCYSTTANPTISNGSIISGQNFSDFNANVSNLIPGTIYYLNAYATTSFGIFYGTQRSFKHLSGIVQLITNTPSSIGANSASLVGEAINDSGSYVTSKGFCWDTIVNPTIINNKYTTTGGTGTFNSTINGLLANKTYYVRTYAINGIGTSYGPQISFTTLNGQLVVTSDSSNNVNAASASVYGTVLSPNGLIAATRGFCYDTLSNPTTASSVYFSGATTNNYVGYLTNLLVNKTYYYRAFATNITGTYYGVVRSFTTNGIITINTGAATNVTSGSANLTGSFINTSGLPILDHGFCISTSSNPTINNDTLSLGSGTSLFSGTKYRLMSNTTYYCRSYAINSTGTFYGNQIVFNTTSGFIIGQYFGGGIIFYIDGTGLHGLIAATNDQSSSSIWGCYNTYIYTNYYIGYGQTNTTSIITSCLTSGIAARICDQLVLNGFSDWFLPSNDELFQLYNQRFKVGNFANFGYWSSYASSNTDAIFLNFNSGSSGSSSKNSGLYVRAIRAF